MRESAKESAQPHGKEELEPSHRHLGQKEANKQQHFCRASSATAPSAYIYSTRAAPPFLIHCHLTTYPSFTARQLHTMHHRHSTFVPSSASRLQPLSLNHRRPAICTLRATNDNTSSTPPNATDTPSSPSPKQQPNLQPKPQPSGVNLSKYASQRSILSSEKDEVTATEVNNLMIKAGKGVRNSPPNL